jgi:hypothetical protein
VLDVAGAVGPTGAVVAGWLAGVGTEIGVGVRVGVRTGVGVSLGFMKKPLGLGGKDSPLDRIWE